MMPYCGKLASKNRILVPFLSVYAYLMDDQDVVAVEVLEYVNGRVALVSQLFGAPLCHPVSIKV